MKQWLSLLFLSLFMGGCAFLNQKTTNSKKAQLYLRLGTSYFAKGDYPNALNQLTIAVQHDPKNPVIQHNLGLSYLVRKRYLKAAEHLRKAVQLEEKYTEARNNLARVLIELSLYEEAIGELKISQEDLTFPYPEKISSHLGIAHFKIGRFNKSINFLKQALAINPDECISNHFLGRSHFELANYSEALQAFDKAVNHCKYTAFDEPTYFLALSHYQVGQKEEAIFTINTLLDKFPDGKYVKPAHKFLDIIQ